MICHYCHAQNDSEAHRCSRCGRRLTDAPERFPVQHSALAPALDPVQPSAVKPPSGPQLVTGLPKAAPTVSEGPAVQPSLFGPMEVVRAVPVRSTRPHQASPKRRSEGGTQQKLDFGAAEGSHTLPTSVEAALYCNAVVAERGHRVVAATMDAAIPVIGFGVFLIVFKLISNEIVIDRHTVPFYLAALVLIGVFYRVLCCIGNVDSVGLQWSGLQLVDFYGRRPGRRERFRRVAGGLVGTGALGIGLLWALADEERLTWHDYMSSTFPTSRLRNS